MKRSASLAAALAGIATLGACVSQTGQPVQLSRAQQGVIGGAAIGALYGATRDSDGRAKGRDAIKGAIVGGAAGGLNEAAPGRKPAGTVAFMPVPRRGPG